MCAVHRRMSALCSARAAGHSGHKPLSMAFRPRHWARLPPTAGPVTCRDVP
jgi:hypothetical protein